MLERSQRVTVRVPDLAEMAAMVEHDDDRTATLIVMTRPDRRLATLRESKALIEYTTPTGIHRLTGALVLDPANPEVLTFTREDRGRVIQRRDNVRVEAVLSVSVTVVDDPTRSGTTSTVNVSGGGLLLREPFALFIGDFVDLELELEPGSARLELRGRVVRTGGEGEKGVRIERIARPDENRLVRFVAERERLAMRVRRGR